MAGFKTLALYHQHKHTQTTSCSASPTGGLGFILRAPVLQCQAPSVAIIDVNPQRQRVHFAKVRVTDGCATHEYSPEKAFCADSSSPLGWGTFKLGLKGCLERSVGVVLTVIEMIALYQIRPAALCIIKHVNLVLVDPPKIAGFANSLQPS